MKNKKWNTLNVVKACGGEWFSEPKEPFCFDRVCAYIGAFKSGDFILVRGDNPDSRGISYKALKKLANNFSGVISDDEKVLNSLKEIPSIKVRDNKTALLNLGFYARKQFVGKVIAVTGSAGKTTTTSMLELIFSSYGEVNSSQFNANLPYGVAWNLSSFNWCADYYVLELAIGNMKTSTALAHPDIAIFTNILPAHLGRSHTVKDIAAAKSNIFTGMSAGAIVILNRDMQEFALVYEKALALDLKVYTYGAGRSNDATLISYDQESGRTTVKLFDREVEYLLSASGYHVALNSIAVLLAVAILDLDVDSFFEHIVNFKALEGRGETTVVSLNNNKIVVIDDAYNANPGSMEAAIQSLGKLNHQGRKGLVLGEMAELGAASKQYHLSLAKFINDFEFDFIYNVGEVWAEVNRSIDFISKCKVVNFNHIDHCEVELRASLLNNDCVLFKGSNSSDIHKIVKSLKSQ